MEGSVNKEYFHVFIPFKVDVLKPVYSLTEDF
jgi:hypothetical protein